MIDKSHMIYFKQLIFRLHIILFVIVGICVCPSSGVAHKLSVFAWVEEDTVFVEGRLNIGKSAKSGEINVYDGKDRLILKRDVNPDGPTSFPLPDYSTGLKIEMKAGEGHSSYWILTPYDIDTQLRESR